MVIQFAELTAVIIPLLKIMSLFLIQMQHFLTIALSTLWIFYNIRGFQVSRADIIPDEDPGYDPDKGITIDLDLHQIYLDQLKVVKEQQNDFNSEEL